MEKVLEAFITTLDSSFKKLLEDVGNPLNLTASQATYIETIYKLNQPTLSELADSLGLSRASVTTAINKLVKQGYITKTQSSEDKRVSHLGLTPSSEKLMQAKQKAVQNYTDFIRAALSQEEIRQFELIMSKLVLQFQNQ
ncbi:MAG: MarR family transcriptional regulator [Trueperaceae bacterium]|nr:MarR family transcriptional regulator [Trueperaceae bacterium]